MEDFKGKVIKSFAVCRNDISSLKEENFELKTEVESLNAKINLLKKSINEISESYIDHTLKLEQTFEKKIKEMFTENQILAKTAIQIPISNKNNSNITNKTKKKDPYEALLEFKAKSNKRNLLKQKIVSMISENGMILSELRFMFVEHFGYSSKATFYNYLKELELEKQIRIERAKSKNFVYLFGMKKEV